MLMVVLVFCVVTEELEHVLHGQFSSGCLALDGRLGKLPLLLLEVEDTRLDRVPHRQLVHDHVASLVEPVDPVDCLFFHELKGR